MRLTKKQALEEFRRYIWPSSPYKDAIAKREAWNNYTDMLCKDRQITDAQYESWTNPF